MSPAAGQGWTAGTRALEVAHPSDAVRAYSQCYSTSAAGTAAADVTADAPGRLGTWMQARLQTDDAADVEAACAQRCRSTAACNAAAAGIADAAGAVPVSESLTAAVDMVEPWLQSCQRIAACTTVAAVNDAAFAAKVRRLLLMIAEGSAAGDGVEGHAESDAPGMKAQTRQRSVHQAACRGSEAAAAAGQLSAEGRWEHAGRSTSKPEQAGRKVAGLLPAQPD